MTAPSRLVQLLEEERQAQGLSKLALERKMGCGKRVWHRISRGALQRPSPQILQEAAQALGVEFAVLPSGEGGGSAVRRCVVCQTAFVPRTTWQVTCGADQCRIKRVQMEKGA